MTTIEEKARRVIAVIEATRKQAREAGVDGADTIGSDAYDVASYVLERSDGSEIRRLRALVDILRDRFNDIGVLAYKALDVPVENPAWPVDPAQPAQFVVPGSIERSVSGVFCPKMSAEERAAIATEFAAVGSGAPDVETTKPDAPKAIRSRAEEQEIPIYEWIPERIFLSSLQTAGEDTDAVAKHLERFRVENAGKTQKRWASVFRSWLERVRKAPEETPLTNAPG